MAEVWTYIDESQAPTATAVDKGQPFWVATLSTALAVPQSLVDGALANLRADPDAKGNPADEATLRRGYFHASLDSKNAHSWLCRAIADSALDASFSASLWYFDRLDSGAHEGADLHRLSALLSSLSILADDYDRVHILAARREGTFEDAEIAAFPDHFMTRTLGSLVSLPAMPTRFPAIDSQPVDGTPPGIQVCDFVLWAVQRARPDVLALKGKVDWVEYLKLKLWAAGGAQGAAHQSLDGELGRGCSRPYLPSPVPLAPRSLETMNDADLWSLAEEIAADIHRCARIAKGHSRIGHLAERVLRAAEGCERAAASAPVELGAILSDMMETFLFVNDTLPVYDPGKAADWARATEKRRLAAAIMLGKRPLWFPDGFSLAADALDVH